MAGLSPTSHRAKAGAVGRTLSLTPLDTQGPDPAQASRDRTGDAASKATAPRKRGRPSLAPLVPPAARPEDAMLDIVGGLGGGIPTHAGRNRPGQRKGRMLGFRSQAHSPVGASVHQTWDGASQASDSEASSPVSHPTPQRRIGHGLCDTCGGMSASLTPPDSPPALPHHNPIRPGGGRSLSALGSPLPSSVAIKLRLI
ncbi:hypothetical protein KIPB_001624 [Kipferlia bialata]|uniref:Uncharacterized protein n=1 Tax=Kipferlia bialata TaxID=797122 RepID=A0A391NIZ1_9EUKA|nr:hypothetical protein KIPB_001624 [Kipferlia bialata]|eukprot:g1624.t1